MSEPNQDQEQIIPKQRERLIVHDDSPFAFMHDSARFDQAYRLAKAMAASSLTPRHLKEDKRGAFDPETVAANCFQVIIQAVGWGFNPFAVAKESYVVAGNLGWQGKLVAAVINTRAGLKERLKPSFTGEGDNLTITLSATFKNEDEPRTVSVSVAQAKTTHEMWVKDPEQKLIYSASIKWARRHCPELVLGVLTDDDVDKIASQEKPAKAKTIEKPVFDDKMREQLKAHVEEVLSKSEDPDGLVPAGYEKHAELIQLVQESGIGHDDFIQGLKLMEVTPKKTETFLDLDTSLVEEILREPKANLSAIRNVLKAEKEVAK